MINKRKVLALYRKELLEFFRDRRTFLVMIFVPALLYPGLLLVMSEINATQAAKQKEQVYTYLLKGLPSQHSIREKLKSNEHLKSWDLSKDEKNPDVKVVFTQDPEHSLQSSSEQNTVNIHYNNISPKSRYASELVQNLLLEWGSEFGQKTLSNLDLNPHILKPLKFELLGQESKEKEGRYLMGRILPGIMIIMLAVGCSFIAQEITAGERERGTLETLFCSPLSALEIVTGKYLTVATVGFFSAFINLASMSLTLSHIVKVMENQGADIQFSLPFSTLPLIFICFVGVACLIAGIQLLVCTQARTMQEAGHYLIPVMLLLSIPIIVSTMPTVELKGAILWVPFINFCLLFQEILVGNFPLEAILAVCLSSLCLSAVAFTLLVKVYESETFISPPSNGTSLKLNRKKIKKKKFPQGSDAIFLFGLMLPIYYYLGTMVQSIDLFWGTLSSFWTIILGGTVFYLFYIKADIKSSLGLKTPTIPQILLGPALAIIALPVVQILALLQKYSGFSGAESEQISNIMKTLIENHGLSGALLCLAITPAVCEEVMFRGAILSGLKNGLNTKAAIFLSALFFGIMHFSIFRLPTTFVLGLLLAALMLKYRNLWICILFHMTFNGIQVFLSTLKEKDIPYVKTLEVLITNPISACFCIIIIALAIRPKRRASQNMG